MNKFFYTVLFFLIGISVSFAEIPQNRGRITDTISVLNSSQIQQLSGKLKLSDGTVAVLLIKTLDGANIDEYASDVFAKWKLGSKDKSDGLLLIIVTQDRKVRIETGFGSESKIVDYQSYQIIEAMKPALKNSDWFTAIAVFATEASKLMNKKDNQ